MSHPAVIILTQKNRQDEKQRLQQLEKIYRTKTWTECVKFCYTLKDGTKSCEQYCYDRFRFSGDESEK